MISMSEKKDICPLEVYPARSREEIEKIAKLTGGKIRRIIFCGSHNGDAPDEGEVNFIMSDEKKYFDED